MEDYYWDIANATKMGEYLTRKEWDVIDSFLENNNISNCLDIGCGSGRFSIPISQRGIDVVAIDNDPIALLKLKEKLNERELQLLKEMQINYHLKILLLIVSYLLK
ncbi:MAG TPA: hypothetical protein DCW46_01195 [Desulfotomaculum sp.]|nr:hypothetical protein [Desulfotomaculum sp.]